MKTICKLSIWSAGIWLVSSEILIKNVDVITQTCSSLI